MVRELAPGENDSTTAHPAVPSCAVCGHKCKCAHAHSSGAVCVHVFASECVHLCLWLCLHGYLWAYQCMCIFGEVAILECAFLVVFCVSGYVGVICLDK